MQEWVPLLLLNGPTRSRIATGLQYLETAHFASMAGKVIVTIAKGMIEDDGELPECPDDRRNDFLAEAINNTITLDDDWCQDVMDTLARADQFRHDDYKFVPQVLEHYEKWLERTVYLHKTNQAADQIAKGQMDLAKATLESIQVELKPAVKQRTDADFFDDVDELLREQAVSHFPLTVDALTRRLHNGGPGRKQTLFYMARTNGGKSLFMCNDAVTLACSGYNVLFVSLEMPRETLAERCYAMFSGITITSLRDSLEGLKGQLTKQLTKLNEVRTLKFKEFPASSVSVNHIERWMDELREKQGWVADVVIVDYLELLLAPRKAQRDEAEHARQKEVANSLKALAQKTNTLVITGTQSNREGAKREANLGLEHAGESYSKLHATDYVVCINQTVEQKMGDAGSNYEPVFSLNVEKNRNGSTGGGHLVQLNPRTLRLSGLA
ncbi:DnaB-like helicase C-terminal domain-containing protein [Paludisphaera borealis]|nr:DnaB-like helicase C-terminal domain-containing protein [Paludisphaera borealis]